MIKTTCIMCPLGCSLTIEKNKNKISVTGNNCKRGQEYGEQELTNPMRNVSTLVKLVQGGVVPVKTSGPIPKDKIDKCLKIISKVILEKKPKIGGVIITNILGLGVDVICIGY